MPRGQTVECVCEECRGVFLVRPYRIRRGRVRFCSVSCGTKHRNRVDNPARREDVRAKISANHANVSGRNNPMFGRGGELAPGFIDGRNSISGDTWRKIALTKKEPVCEICGARPKGRQLHVHHRDKDRSCNSLSNLQILCATCHNTAAHPRMRDGMGRYEKEVPSVADRN